MEIGQKITGIELLENFDDLQGELFICTKVPSEEEGWGEGDLVMVTSDYDRPFISLNDGNLWTESNEDGYEFEVADETKYFKTLIKVD